MAKFTLHSTAIPEVKLVEGVRVVDGRGHFAETYSKDLFHLLGIEAEFVQDNYSLSIAQATLRGLHYQTGSAAQAKLVRVTRGRIWDVAVDLRRHSGTFGAWAGVELTAENQLQLFVPVGFAHGFVTLDPYTEVAYKVSSIYSAEHDAGIRWDDRTLGIEWPIDPLEDLMSAKDRALPALHSAWLFE